MCLARLSVGLHWHAHHARCSHGHSRLHPHSICHWHHPLLHAHAIGHHACTEAIALHKHYTITTSVEVGNQQEISLLSHIAKTAAHLRCQASSKVLDEGDVT